MQVGSSSLRRRAQALEKRPDLQMVEFRGNVQTRMRKLSEGVAGGVPGAGLSRLGHDDPMIDPPETMLPAVAQGAIGIEGRAADRHVADLLAPIDHADTRTRLAAERAFLGGLDGSCRTPLAGLAELSEGRIALRGGFAPTARSRTAPLARGRPPTPQPW